MKTVLLIFLAFNVGAFVLSYVVNTVRLIIEKRKDDTVNNKKGENDNGLGSH